MHFEEKIVEKKHVYILVTKIYYWNIQRTWNGYQKVDIDRFTPFNTRKYYANHITDTMHFSPQGFGVSVFL